jgi:preprotein translocase subunit YajC
MAIRPQMKRAKEHRALLSGLSKGDEVLTNGGVAGRIDDLGESFVTVEIADGVKVKVQKNAISAVLPKGSLKSA